MQTLTIDGTRYTISHARDPIELAKLARKPYRPKKPKDLRRIPARSDLSTAEYIREFCRLNFLTDTDYVNERYLAHGTAHYDPAIPLLEVFNDE